MATLICLLLGAALALAACSGGGRIGGRTSTSTAGNSSSVAQAKSNPSTTTKPAGPTRPVHVSTLQSDNDTFGVGFAVVAQFDVAPATSQEFAKVAKITVNDQPYDGAWFFQTSSNPAYKMEAIFRGQNYWPAHAKIHVDMPLKGVSAGTGLSFANNLTVDVATGPALIGTVDAQTSKLTLTRDGTQYVFPVALGAPTTPTMFGTKVMMDKHKKERMIGNSYDEIVDFSMRISSSGEYLHAAPWNIANITSGRPSSNGCTNMLPTDAQKLYDLVEQGDVFQYPNAPGKQMPSWDGFGWWNTPWPMFKAGGLLINHGTGD